MVSYSKLTNKSKQISHLSEEFFLNFGTFLYLDNEIFINFRILGQVRDKLLVIRSLNVLQMQRKWYSDSTKERSQSLHILLFLTTQFILQISSLCDDNLNFVSAILKYSLFELFR